MATASTTRSKSWFTHFQYKDGEDSAADARNVLLVVATLIAAVTFQAGVNPPGGVWQDDDLGHKAGSAIYASRKQAYYVFLVFNTVALSTSVLIIMSLTYRFPFHLEILIATASMLVTYGSAIFAVTPHESYRFKYVLVAAALPFLLRGLIRMFYMCRSKIYKCLENF
ncbi:hypothetical protein CMV_015886 [Castanea mollissima]|uniref:PGG domain-containing protein n=1 Tax=Castanea mollissima TaxID=60419 RepID=A0A8J4VJQ3_9ROSI|nr:hypothetical protein CMV_015886 [Castanea mollissima]